MSANHNRGFADTWPAPWPAEAANDVSDYADDYDEPPPPVWVGWLTVAIMLASAGSMVALIVWAWP